MPTFCLPESYRAYLKDPAVRSAVDHILNRKKLEVPADLEWERLPDFHAAVLAAHQVRSDYATALHGALWSRVWQPALDECGFADSLELQSFNEQLEYSNYPCDTYSLWENDLLERVYNIGDHVLGLGAEFGLEQTWLTVWLLNGRGEDLTTRLALGDDWDSELDDEGYLYSSEKLAPILDCHIALDPLNRAAKRALQEIGRILGIPKE